MFSFVKRVLKKTEESASVPKEENREFIVHEAGLRMADKDGIVSVSLFNRPDILFSVSGLELSMPNTVRTKRLNSPAVILNLGEDLIITCIQIGKATPSEAKVLQRAVKKAASGNKTNLEFLFYNGTDEIRYEVELSPKVKLCEFKEYVPKEAVFNNVPSTNQMVAFLKATLHQRRTTLRSLCGMSRRCKTPRICSTIEYMVQKLSPNYDFSQQIVTEISQAVEAKGKTAYPNTIAALCILADIFLGRIQPSTIDEMLETNQTVLFSDDAAYAAAKFLGAKPVSEVLAQADLALGFLMQTVSSRNVRTTLQDLAEDGASQISMRAVNKIISCVPEEFTFRNDEQDALCQYLHAHGKRINADTLSAVCLYVELEAGIITEKEIEDYLHNNCFSDHSLYALLSVSCAFDVDLRCVCFVGDYPGEMWKDLEKVLALSSNGVMARFVKKGEPGFRTAFIPDKAKLNLLRDEELHFTGEVLLNWPVIDYLDANDFGVCLNKGLPILASYISEDRVVRWKFTDDTVLHNKLPESVVGKYGFIDGFRAYRFYNKLVGRYCHTTAEELLGKRAQIVVYVNHRGNRTLKYIPLVDNLEKVTTPPSMELTFAEEVVEFPTISSFMMEIVEPTHEYSLGTINSYIKEHLQVSMCLKGVKHYLTRSTSSTSLRNNTLALTILRNNFKSPGVRQSLMDALDYNSRCFISAMIGKTNHSLLGDIVVSSAVMDALNQPETAEIGTLCVIYAMCHDLQNTYYKYVRLWRKTAFQQIILKKLLAFLGSGTPTQKSIACALLLNNSIAMVKANRDAATYALVRMLSDEKVGFAAAVSLAALSLAPSVPLVDMAICIGWESSEINKLIATERIAENLWKLEHWLSQTGTSLEIPARANLKGEESKVKALAKILSLLNVSFVDENNWDPGMKYVILPSGRADALRELYFRIWTRFVGDNSIIAVGAQVLDEKIYGNFVDAVCKYEKTNKCSALLRNPEIITMKHNDVFLTEIDPLFLSLASLVPPQQKNSDILDSPAICRFMHSNKLVGEDALDVASCEIFCPEAGIWVPFLHSRFVSNMHLTSAERELYQAQSDLYGNVFPFFEPKSSNIPDCPKNTSRESWDSPEYPTLNKLAEHLAESFNLPRASWRFAVNILLGTAPVSKYPLPPYQD